MGLLGAYIKRKYPEKAKYYVLIDWITDLLLAAAFIYMSWQIRIYMLNCTCPFCGTTVPSNLSNTTVNITNITSIGVGK
jgi:hypothetical protein